MVSEPVAAKGVLGDDHGQTDQHGVGDSHKAITGQTITAEDEAADDGLQKVVGEAHAAKETEMA